MENLKSTMLSFERMTGCFIYSVCELGIGRDMCRANNKKLNK